jgi:hypothetical protein
MVGSELHHFFQILQSGDQQAIDALLRELDPFVRKIIRLRLLDGRLRRVMDTTDIFHSLLKDFLARKTSDPLSAQTPVPALGQRNGENGADASAGLRAYLAAAVHHKIETRARKERRHAGGLPIGWDIAGPEPAPSRRVEAEDFRQAIRVRLSEDTQLLFDLKGQALSWNEIATKVGGSPDALRMRLARAVAAALSDLGYNGTSHAESV